MRLRRIAATVGVSLSVFGVSVAQADTVDGTRFDVVERAHTIDVRLEHGHATLVVTRVVENPGAKSDQATFHIDLPEGAVATRLRTAGVGPNGQPIWFEGELMEAEAAAKKYEELTGIGGYYPKDPALLSWRTQHHLALQVFPVPPKSTKTVEYTLRIPMKYAEGSYLLQLPRIGTTELPARVRFTAADPLESVVVNGVSGGGVVEASKDLEVRLKPRGPLVDGALSSTSFARDRVLVHARIAAAPRLGEVPANAAVVVLIDASVSMRADLPSAVAAAQAYVANLPPTASVEVLTFDRVVHAPFGGALSAKDALAKLSSFNPTPANGSQVDDALAQADAKLAASASSSSARRILLLTDLRTRAALTAERFGRRTLASGALLHLASVHAGTAHVERNDESPWATLPRATGGLFWNAECDVRGSAAQRKVFEEWARPIRIDKLKVTGMPANFAAPETLNEGDGLEHFDIESAPVGTVTLEGELWSRSVKWSAAPTDSENRRWAGLVFGSHLLSQLSEPEEMTLALAGRAVSPVTSYLAIEPGVRPSTDGLEEGEGEGGGGHGMGIGLGSIGTIGHGGGSASSFDPQAFLDRELTSAARGCGVGVDMGTTAKVESTVDELVDVRDVALTPVRDAKKEACVRERLWQVALPRDFTADQASYDLVALP
jgi:hypothetical protein